MNGHTFKFAYVQASFAFLSSANLQGESEMSAVIYHTSESQVSSAKIQVKVELDKTKRG